MDRFASPPPSPRRTPEAPEAPRRHSTEMERILLGERDGTGNHAPLLALLQRDADAAVLPGHGGQPPLHFALQCRCPPPVLALLLQHGARVDGLDARGRTLLCQVLLLRHSPLDARRSTRR